MTALHRYIAVTMILIISGTIQSIACSCDGESTVAGSVKHTDIVFSGKVVSKFLAISYQSLGVHTKDTAKMESNILDLPVYVVIIKVDKVYKGHPSSDTLKVLTPRNGTVCGYSFQVGQNYIVYGDFLLELFGKQVSWTNHCTRTQIWNADEEKEIIKVTK